MSERKWLLIWGVFTIEGLFCVAMVEYLPSLLFTTGGIIELIAMLWLYIKLEDVEY